MSEKLQQVTKTLAEREQLAAIIWAVIGVTQVLSGFMIIAGAWNIYAAYTRYKQSKAVAQPWPGIVESYEKWQTNIIINIVINVVFGGVYGVIGGLYDLFAVRAYVLDNKAVFEEAGL